MYVNHRVVCSKYYIVRPVGSKFEMVQPYYSTKRAHDVLWHAHLAPHARRPVTQLLLSNCFLGRFEAVVAES